MVDMPAWCPRCNIMVDEAGGFSIGDGANVIFENCSVTCPRCWGEAKVIEGQFSIRDGIINVITASPWTRARLAEYQSALQWASENFETQPDAAISRLEQSDPATAELAKQAANHATRKRIATWLGALALAIAQVLAEKAIDKLLDDDPVPPAIIIQNVNSDPAFQQDRRASPSPSSAAGPPPPPRSPIEPPRHSPGT